MLIPFSITALFVVSRHGIKPPVDENTEFCILKPLRNRAGVD
jgi:hypothetical protein